MRTKAWVEGRQVWLDQGEGNGISWDAPRRGMGQLTLQGQLVQGEPGPVEQQRAARRRQAKAAS